MRAPGLDGPTPAPEKPFGLFVSSVKGTPKYLTGQSSGVLAVFQEHLSVDDHVVNPRGSLLNVHLSAGETVHGLARRRGDCVGVEDGYVGGLAGSNEAPVMQVVHDGGFSSHPVHGIFQGHYLLFPDPVAQ